MQIPKSGLLFFSLGNFVNTVETAFASGIGWLITFCTEQGGKYMFAYQRMDEKF